MVPDKLIVVSLLLSAFNRWQQGLVKMNFTWGIAGQEVQSIFAVKVCMVVAIVQKVRVGNGVRSLGAIIARIEAGDYRRNIRPVTIGGVRYL